MKPEPYARYYLARPYKPPHVGRYYRGYPLSRIHLVSVSPFRIAPRFKPALVALLEPYVIPFVSPCKPFRVGARRVPRSLVVMSSVIHDC